MAAPDAGAGRSVASLFQTGSGKSVTVSKAALETYETKLRAEDDSLDGDIWPSGACDASKGQISQSEKLNEDTRDNLSEGFGVQIRERNAPKQLTHALEPKQTSRCNRRAPTNGRDRTDRDTTDQSDDSAVGFSSPTALPLHLQRRRLEGDKENLHPENVLVRQTAALEASKPWRSTPSVNQLSPRSSRRALSLVHNQNSAMDVKKSMKPSIGPSRARVGGRKRFHPPVPIKSQRASSINCLEERSAVYTKLKKQRVTGAERPHFVYRETMRIPFSHLVELRDNQGSVELPGIQELNLITAANAIDVRFARIDFRAVMQAPPEGSYDTELFIGPRELYFQLKAQKQILKSMGATYTWFLNHYRWVVWKLAAMERTVPRLLLHKYLTKDQVLRQICHRYERDLYMAQRSILKKILHRDASSLSCMTLCIAAVLSCPVPKDHPIDQELPACWNMALVLTDGWYSIYAVPDPPLAAVLWEIHERSNIVGTKIATWNASLQNSNEGIDPLECAVVREKWKNPLLAKEDLTRWPYLQLRYNSTRRVRFDTRLGIEKLHYTAPVKSSTQKQQPQPTFSLLKSVPLKSLEVGGGMVRSVRVRVTRISPVLYLQAKEWTLGPRILCEEQLEVYFQLRSEYLRADRSKRYPQARVQDTADDWMVSNDLSEDQLDVPLPMPFIKLNVECTHPSVDGGVGRGILTVWRPSEELLSGALREGSEYFASSLTVNWKIEYGRGQDAFVRLSSTKHTGFEQVSDDSVQEGSAIRSDERQKTCVDIQRATMDYRSDYNAGQSINEQRATIDVCAYVVLVADRETQDSTASTKKQAETSLLDPAIKPKESRFVEHVFVTDRSHHLMSIRVSGMEASVPRINDKGTVKTGRLSSFVFRKGSKSVWKEGAIVCLSGLEVSHYDEQLRVLDCVLVESTQIVSFPSKKSPFWDDFRFLQSELGVSTQRAHLSQEPSSSTFAEQIKQLKKYVERDILLLDFAPTQEHDHHHAEVVEQERLTQDLQTHDEESEKNASDQVDAFSNSLSHNYLRWNVTVVNILPLPGASRLVFPRDVIAFGCVNVGTGAEAIRTVYLDRASVISLRALLETGDMPKLQHSDGSEPQLESDDQLIQSVMQILDKRAALKDRGEQAAVGNMLRLEVRQSANERLINSWKPWERLSASYWAVISVAAVSTA